MFHVLASRILLTKEFDWKIITFYIKKKVILKIIQRNL